MEEDGAYLRLLRLCWRTPGCSVPDDPKWIMRKMRISADDYYRVVEPIINEFFTRGMGRIFNARLQKENDEINAKHKARSEAGKKGNAKRWGSRKPPKTNKNSNRKATVLQSQPEPEPEPELKGVTPPTPHEVLSRVLTPKTAEDFIAHRKAMKKPVTVVAAERLIAKVKDHPNPDAVFDDSIANGWQGIFPERIKNDRSDDRTNRPSADDICRAADAIARRL